MTTQPQVPQPMPPPPQINIQATPDGKYVVLQVSFFVELSPAGQIGEALTNLVRQLRTGLILPNNNGQVPPPFDQDRGK